MFPSQAPKNHAVCNNSRVHGKTYLDFGPAKPDGVSAGNWIETDPKKGWFTILSLYSPLDPFITKKWRPNEIELVK